MNAVVAQAEVLADLLERARAPHALFLLDLDDTLFSTAARHLRILREFGRGLEAIEASALRYSISETLRDAGFADERLHAELREFWFKRFFKNRYLREDLPVPGAPEYCRALRKRGAALVYLTGRDETMREGTLRSLERHDFPEPDGRDVHLVLKPSFDAPDLDFKNAALARVSRLGQVVGGFENEPAHVNLFQTTFPSARMVFVDTKHSGKPVTPRPDIPWIRDFRAG